jgi:predicted NBD/HSP70 family sugar kinase
MIIIGDIGGTHMRIAVSDTPDSFEEPVIYDTPPDFTSASATFAQAIADVAHGRKVDRAVIGIAGLVSKEHQALLRSPHLRGWEGKNIAQSFGQAINAPVYLENDAVLGGLGEAKRGAGVGASIVAYITVGTGLGGARIVDGRIDRGSCGFEIGHQLLGTTPEAPEWEALVSGSGIEKRYGKPASELNDIAIWNESARYFAYGLYNTILHWSPDRVVLGGASFRLKNSIPIEPMKNELRAIATALTELPDIQLAKLGDHSGLYGAIDFTGA